ncbi:MAG: phosphatase, partial [Bacteroidota bacterium]
MTSLQDLDIDWDWTLFLDRDGVINQRIIDDYVKTPDELVMIDGSLEAIRVFSIRFGLVLVVTNQQGIGKGLMTEENLVAVHGKLHREVALN